VRTCFVINARQKQDHVAKAVHGALSQTVPCEILLSDQGSTDDTILQMARSVDAFGTNHHQVRIVECPIVGPFCMEMANAHFEWACEQVAPDTEYIFQSSADDYSLPDRVKVCMEEIDRLEIKPSCIACTMYYEEPGKINRQSVSGYPTETGFVKAGEGLLKLAYGSTIHGWHVDFVKKVKGMAGKNTPDVLWGFLAALDKGFYVVTNPQHVHVTHADLNNLGFQGKMRAATGEEAFRMAELNVYQLLHLYYSCAGCAQQLWPEGIPQDDWNAVLNQIFGLSKAWLDARNKLHELKITPGIID